MFTSAEFSSPLIGQLSINYANVMVIFWVQLSEKFIDGGIPCFAKVCCVDPVNYIKFMRDMFAYFDIYDFIN